MPHGVAALRRLGILPDEECGRPFVGVRYVEPLPAGGALVAEAHFPEGTGLGIRRLQLHLALARRAEQTGVELHWGEAVNGVAHRGSRPARTARGALDRRRGRAALEGAALAGSRGSRIAGGASACAGTTRSTPGPTWWRSTGATGPTPTSPRSATVSSVWPSWRRRAASAAMSCCAASLAGRARRGSAARLRGARRRTVPAAREGARRGNVVLVGDASGYFDAITGEGLSLASSRRRRWPTRSRPKTRRATSRRTHV